MVKLALCGGTPAVKTGQAHYRHPQMSDGFWSGIHATDVEKNLITFEGGGLVSQVEATFKSVMSAQYTLATNSGTSALYAMYYATGLGEGDDVLVPGYTFFATAMPLFRLGCRPILVDSLDNGNIDPADIRRKVTPATKAIVITHMWGIPCDMDEIMALACELNLPVLEDASHAHGATYRGSTVGTIGSAAAWSLGAKKIVTGGQGGMLQTGDRELFERASLVSRANDRVHEGQISQEAHAPYAVTGCGLNMRMHPFSAVAVNDQLQRLPQQLKERREVSQYLMDELRDVPGISFPKVPEGAEPAWYAIPMLYDSAALRGIPKQFFVNALIAEGAVDADTPGSTCPLTEYRTFTGAPATFTGAPVAPVDLKPGDLPVAERFHHRMIKFPAWYGERRDAHVHAYSEAVIKVVENIDELYRLWQSAKGEESNA